MYRVFLLTRPGPGMTTLAQRIESSGLFCRAASDLADLEETAHAARPDVVALDLAAVGIGAQSVIEQIDRQQLPTLLLIDRAALGQYDPALQADDFIAAPPDAAELLARVKQIVFRRNGRNSDQVIRVGELTIDPRSYEVNMAGRRISLTYKEFQLLTLLASNPGRVYTREALLNQVWGYDYLGGTRTVDVHIRRLRSKVEDPDHLFVETIWNVGYRFRNVAADRAALLK